MAPEFWAGKLCTSLSSSTTFPGAHKRGAGPTWLSSVARMFSGHLWFFLTGSHTTAPPLRPSKLHTKEPSGWWEGSTLSSLSLARPLSSCVKAWPPTWLLALAPSPPSGQPLLTCHGGFKICHRVFPQLRSFLWLPIKAPAFTTESWETHRPQKGHLPTSYPRHTLLGPTKFPQGSSGAILCSPYWADCGVLAFLLGYCPPHRSERLLLPLPRPEPLPGQFSLLPPTSLSLPGQKEASAGELTTLCPKEEVQ